MEEVGLRLGLRTGLVAGYWAMVDMTPPTGPSPPQLVLCTVKAGVLTLLRRGRLRTFSSALFYGIMKRMHEESETKLNFFFFFFFFFLSADAKIPIGCISMGVLRRCLFPPITSTCRFYFMRFLWHRGPSADRM
jgi:hypothetical protein